ncbi:MAG: hypothetical protein AAGC64_00595 [Bacteroidota bacterium]
MSGLQRLTSVIFLSIFCNSIFAQDQGLIYGKVITENGDEYIGPIRWGKEEVYWSDMFNASKKENKNLAYLSDRELSQLEDQNSDSNIITKFISISWDWDDEYDFIHEFSTAFGNIGAINIKSSDRIELALKNGESLNLDGSGYNDVGTKINVLDNEIGMIQLSWRNIERIEFLSTPSILNEKFGEPLYGTVKSDVGEFTGYVQWDHDERLGSDELDGDTKDGEVSIPFGKIQSIARDGYSRSIVALKSGRELELRGSNDVNNKNRGIIVTVEGFGRVDIEWEDFDAVVFKEAPNSGNDYRSYSAPEPIQGIVSVDNGDEHTGEIIYDLDEEYTIEVLNGKDDDTKFIIPFRNIKLIKPIGSDEAKITLKNGDTLVLEDSQDVGKNHQGILINTKNERVYVPWDRVELVTLK